MKYLLVYLPPAIVMAVCVNMPSQVWAQSTPSGDSVQIQGVTVTTSDIHQFLTAMATALKPNDMTVPVIVEGKPSSEMPSYDQQAHYDGIRPTKSGAKAMYIFINKDLKVEQTWNAFTTALTLAIIDGGYAGKDLKQLYDVCAAKDAQVPADAPDPFLYRRKLAAVLVAYLNQK